MDLVSQSIFGMQLEDSLALIFMLREGYFRKVTQSVNGMRVIDKMLIFAQS